MAKGNVQVSAKLRQSSKYVVKYPTLPSLTAKPNGIMIRQVINRHDVYILEYRTTGTKTFKLLKTGVPVQFTVTQGTASKKFYGYVSHVSKETVGQRKAIFKIHCIGASYVLKKRSRKVYKKKTIPEVAKIIGQKHGFKVVWDNHPRRFDQLAVSGHSEWEWLHEQARRIGYGMTVDGMTLIFRPLDKLIDQYIKDVPVMSMFASLMPKNSLYLDRTLDYFEVQNGENIESNEHKRSVKHVGGVNPLSGKSFTSKKDPKTSGKKLRKKVSDTLFSEQMHKQVVNDAASAKLMAEAEAALARFSIPAEGKGQGDVRLKPYAITYVTGTGEMTDGYWIVNKVTHYLGNLGTYNVEMMVSTDGLGEESNRKGTTNKVDISAALQRKHVRQRTPRLLSKSGLFVEGNQGLNRTPTLWKSSESGPRRIC